MYIKDLNIVDSFNVTGRGTVLVTDLFFDEAVSNFKLGDVFSYAGKYYSIIGKEALLKSVETGKEDFLAFIVEEITELQKIEREFVSLLWEMPQHWFSEINAGIPVMKPINPALYQAFLMTTGYEFGFDLAPVEQRTRSYKNDKGQEITFELMPGGHPDDWKILLPLFEAEKKKYLQITKTKQILSGRKNIFGMIHLSFDQADDGVIKRAIREVQLLEEEGVNGIIVENYHGSVDDVKEFFEAAKSVLENSKLMVGINILPNEYKKAFELADKVGAKFIQLDFVAGVYNNNKSIYEAHYTSVRNSYPHIAVLGGVWPKYYTPVKDSVLKNDLQDGMRRADAIVVTGEGTGKQTPLKKIEEFQKITKNFPLIVGAGLTSETAQEQLEISNGAIVGSAFKPASVTSKEISRELVKKFMDVVKKI